MSEVFYLWDGFQWLAYREPEGITGSGATKEEAFEDLLSLEDEWHERG